ESFPLQVLLQWRWDNDREALLAQEAAKKAKRDEERRLADERRAEMLRTLTLDGISNRTWFESWGNELDGANLPEARQLVYDLVENLRNSPKLTKAIARRLLRATVENFNRLDEKNSFIETTHREDIHEALEIVMAAARYPDLADEVEQWRDW